MKRMLYMKRVKQYGAKIFVIMKRIFAILVLGMPVALLVAACATRGDVAVRSGETAVQSFDLVRGKVWALDRIEAESGAVIINRLKLEADGEGDVFTLTADAERISGKGLPNRYVAPYALGEDQEISISPIAGTLMMGLVEPEGLQEREYFNYLEQANQWLVTGDTLELCSETIDGDPVTMVFVLR
jgi:heat shock protein HslJ